MAETVQSRAGAVWCLAGECCRLLRPQLTNVTAAAASALPSVCSTQSRPVCSQTHNNTLQHCCSDGDGDPNSPVISDPAVLSIPVSTLQCTSFSRPRNQSIHLTVPRGSDNMFLTMISDVDKSDILFAGLACAHSF